MTIAPGIFGTPTMFGIPQEVEDLLAASVPLPSRLCTPEARDKLVKHIVENDMLNGQLIRLGGAIRLAPKYAESFPLDSAGTLLLPEKSPRVCEGVFMHLPNQN